MKRSLLLTWTNGNISDLDKWDVVKLARYFERLSLGLDDEIEEDIEED